MSNECYLKIGQKNLKNFSGYHYYTQWFMLTSKRKSKEVGLPNYVKVKVTKNIQTNAVGDSFPLQLSSLRSFSSWKQKVSKLWTILNFQVTVTRHWHVMDVLIWQAKSLIFWLFACFLDIPSKWYCNKTNLCHVKNVINGGKQFNSEFCKLNHQNCIMIQQILIKMLAKIVLSQKTTLKHLHNYNNDVQQLQHRRQHGF